MTQAAAQWATFAREVARDGRLWTLRDSTGFPAPETGTGGRAQPFWSSLARVRNIISTVPAYNMFEPYEVSWSDFREKWAPGLEKDGLKVGVNWTGPRATGYDIEPSEVVARVEYEAKREDGAAPEGSSGSDCG